MEESELHCKVTVRILADKKAFGPGVAALLRGVRDCRSLQGAARQMDMSYSKPGQLSAKPSASGDFL